KLHMTVPRSFRKNSETPEVLVLHYADLAREDVEEREGYRVTRPMRAILDLSNPQTVSNDILVQAFSQGRSLGLITEKDVEQNRNKLPDFLFPKEGKPLKTS